MDRFSCDTSPAEDRDQSSFELGASGLSEDIPLSLLQPSTSIDNVEPSKTVHHPQRHLGIVSSLALVIGMEIGSGIFSSPGVIVANTKSIGASLLVWFVSGCLAWTGASSFAELGSAIPLDGGAQAYLAYAVTTLQSSNPKNDLMLTSSFVAVRSAIIVPILLDRGVRSETWQCSDHFAHFRVSSMSFLSFWESNFK